MRGYAICTEPRSGSSLLCRMLDSTGLLGKPTEYFNGEVVRDVWRVAAYPDDIDLQIDAIPRLGATPNGVYGLKVFSRHAGPACAAGWIERLPALSFIYLERLDVLGQALSRVRALQTGKWFSRQSERASPYYDHKQISEEVLRLAQAGARWRYFFARNGLPILSLSYEQLTQAPQAVVDAIARWVGVGEPATIDPGRFPHLTIQRDALTDEWRARYIAETRDLRLFQ